MMAARLSTCTRGRSKKPSDSAIVFTPARRRAVEITRAAEECPADEVAEPVMPHEQAVDRDGDDEQRTGHADDPDRHCGTTLRGDERDDRGRSDGGGGDVSGSGTSNPRPWARR